MLSDLRLSLSGCVPLIVDPKFTAALAAFFTLFKGFRLACEPMWVAPVLALRKPRPTLLSAMPDEIDRQRRMEDDIIRLGRPPVA